MECSVCESKDSVLLYKRPRWTIYQCNNCGLVRVQVMSLPSAEIEREGLLNEAKGGDYMQKVFIDRHDFWMEYWRKQVDLLSPFVRSSHPRLLDVGCAMGHFMLAAREDGWLVEGVELSKRQADYARKEFNLNVYDCPIEEIDFQTHSFDIITLWSVIEHIHDPKAVMTKVNNLLKPGGIVVLKTPNQDSLITMLAHWTYVCSGGRYMLPVYSDDHIFRFSEKSLHCLYDVTGFEVLKITQDDNLEVMKTRMQLYKHYNLYRLVMGIVHTLARPMHRENQLLSYARVL